MTDTLIYLHIVGMAFTIGFLCVGEKSDAKDSARALMLISLIA